MRSSSAITGMLMLLFVACANAQEEVVAPPPPGITETAPAPAVERPKPQERPKPEKPKPVEKPRSEMENPSSLSNPVATSVKPAENAVPMSTPTAATVPMAPATGRTGYSFGCLALAFAMLILGMAAGFLGRHLMSRHKLGGMTVRIGTWRGIP